MGQSASTFNMEELQAALLRIEQFNDDFAKIKIKVATLERSCADLVKRVQGLEKTELLHSQPHDREESLM